MPATEEPGSKSGALTSQARVSWVNHRLVLLLLSSLQRTRTPPGLSDHVERTRLRLNANLSGVAKQAPYSRRIELEPGTSDVCNESPHDSNP
jgi:hypothetical protein